jgi:protease-4
MWQKIRPFFTGLGLVVFCLALVGFGFFLNLTPGKPEPLPESIFLSLTIDNTYGEKKSFDLKKREETPSIHNLSNALRRAAKDDRVKSLSVRFVGGDFSLSSLQEIQNPLRQLREKGKHLTIYSENYAPFGNGTTTYYLASFFDEIWLQPTGSVDVSGVHIEIPFVRSLLDKIGVTPQLTRREEFKSAAETFLLSEMTNENRQMMTSVTQGLMTQIEKGVLQNKPSLQSAWSNAVQQSPLNDDQALSMGLITHIGYWDEFVDQQDNFIRKNGAGDIIENSTESIPLWDYVARSQPDISLNNPPKVALITMDGFIPETTYKGNKDGVIDPLTMVNALNTAADDETIKAIIIRLTSPGGSPSGSETMKRAIEKAREKGKKVYVSMGLMATSGGYWTSLGGETIYATPATLTGSIGVYGGKLSLEKLWQKIGIQWRSVDAGPDISFWTPNFSYTEDQKQKLETVIDDIYHDFLTRVSESRGLDTETTRRIAKGRVWTGEQALEIGLVDKLGGLDVVIEDTKKDLGLTKDDQIILIPYPEPLSPLEQVLDTLTNLISLQAKVSHTFSLWLSKLSVYSSPALVLENRAYL